MLMMLRPLELEITLAGAFKWPLRFVVCSRFNNILQPVFRNGTIFKIIL